LYLRPYKGLISKGAEVFKWHLVVDLTNRPAKTRFSSI
jgi:hypothetical protein